jgi:hypothetical protein
VFRKIALFLALAVLGGISTQAQSSGDKIELSAGYSYLHFKALPAANLNGFEASGQYKLRDWLGGVADVSGEYGKVGGFSSRVYTYMFGPQVTWTHFRRFSPFAHALLGGAHFDGGGYASRGFAWDIGAGVDTPIRGKLSWRIIQADALPTHLGNNEQHSTRVSSSIVYRF